MGRRTWGLRWRSSSGQAFLLLPLILLVQLSLSLLFLVLFPLWRHGLRGHIDHPSGVQYEQEQKHKQHHLSFRRRLHHFAHRRRQFQPHLGQGRLFAHDSGSALQTLLHPAALVSQEPTLRQGGRLQPHPPRRPICAALAPARALDPCSLLRTRRRRPASRTSFQQSVQPCMVDGGW